MANSTPTSMKPAGHAQLPPLLRRAVTAHQSGQLETARPLYRDFLAEHPEHPTALQLFGLLHSQCGEFDTAIGLMQKSLDLFPDQAEVANNLGNALSAAGRLREAVECYARAIRLRPDYLDAFRNLGLCYLRLGIADDARVCFERCVQISPGDAAAWMGLGNAHLRLPDLRRAGTCFEKAISLRPDYAEAHYNLGVCLASMHRPGDAMQRYQQGRRLGLDRAELHHYLALAQEQVLDPASAVNSLREAIRRDPLDVASHRELGRLLWEQETPGDCLGSFEAALAEQPRSIPLRLEYARALNTHGRHEEAETLLMEGLRESPGSSVLKNQLAFTYEGQRRWADSVQLHAAAVSMPDSTPGYLVDYARALLAWGRPEEALPQVERAIAQVPLDQRAIAYLGLCWRLLGDERDAILNDHDRFIGVFEVSVPGSSGEFNDRLAAVVRSLHTGHRCSPGGTIRGGTRSSCDLLGRGEPEIRDLFTALDECIRDYIDRLPPHGSHPFLARRGNGFAIAASWSVRLARGGCHAMHVHQGWISSAYYVQVPPEIAGDDTRGGEIVFGEPDIDVGTHGTARRTIRPEAGRLVLFPSYMWHGTRPFDAEGERIAVSFDAVPGPAE